MKNHKINALSDSLLKWIVLSGFFLLPIIYWPGYKIPFEIPKVWFFNRWVEILGFTAVLLASQNLIRKKLDLILILLVALFLTAVVISSVTGVDFTKSFWGNYYRRDGIHTLVHLIILFIVSSVFYKDSWLEPLSKAISLGVAITSIVSILNGISFYLFKNITIPNFGGGIGGTFGQPNFLAGYFIVSFPFILYTIQKVKKGFERKIYLGIVLLTIIAIILTRSLVGIIGIPLIFFLKSILSKRTLKMNLSILLVSLVIFISSISYLFHSYNQIITANGFVAESRTRIFVKAYLAFKQKPFLGWGWANFDHAFESVTWPIKLDHDVYVDKAHSDLLEVLVTSGLFGLVTYLAILLKAGINLNKTKTIYPLLFSFILLVLHTQTNVVSISEEALLWFIAGVSAGVPHN